MGEFVLRRFNERGLREFGRAIKMLAGTAQEPDRSLLEDTRYTEVVLGHDVDLERLGFEKKRDWAVYIDMKFTRGGISPEADYPGMWEWLTWLYWDSLCKRDDSGIWQVVSGEKYSLDPKAAGLDGDVKPFRHLLRDPYLLYHSFKDCPTGSKHQKHLADLILNHPLCELDDISEQLAGSRRLRASAAVVLVASMLFYDRTSDHTSQARSSDDSFRNYCRFVRNLPIQDDLREVSHWTLLAQLDGVYDNRIKAAGLMDEVDMIRSVFQETVVADDDQPQGNLLPVDPLKIMAQLEMIDGRDHDDLIVPTRAYQFRRGILGSYGFKCAVSGIGLATEIDGELQYEVQAAHIVPVAKGGRDLLRNGIALTSTLHWAFDRGLFSIDLNGGLRVKISDGVLEDDRNRWLSEFDGRRLSLPSERELYPDPEFLDWHANNVARR